MGKLIRMRKDGSETVVECFFCGQELHRFRTMFGLESPNEVRVQFREKAVNHLVELHRNNMADQFGFPDLRDEASS